MERKESVIFKNKRNFVDRETGMYSASREHKLFEQALMLQINRAMFHNGSITEEIYQMANDGILCT